MGARAPSTSDLQDLSRDDWEALGHDLCAVMYDAERVEDRLGRGNGLDSLRRTEAGEQIEGWQFRRFDDRLGAKQIAELRKAVTRAVKACRRDLGGSLKTFTVFGNVDLQPGHGRSKGEDARFTEFREWCKTQYGVIADYKGITWVCARLLSYPRLRPDLFEDLPAAIDSAKREILAAIGGDKLTAAVFEQLKAKSDGQIAVLVAEANVHFKRGQTRGQEESWALAIESLQDARRLASAPGVEPQLQGMIDALLTGLLCVTGRVGEALLVGRQAVVAATRANDVSLLRLAQGNLAMALNDAQQFDEARSLFVATLGGYEDAAELSEVVRTLTHLVHVDTNLKNWAAGATWAKRLQRECEELDKAVGPTETSINALGSVAVFHVSVAVTLPVDLQERALRRASGHLQTVAELARLLDIRRTSVIAESELARTLWLLNDYDDSEAAFERAVRAADREGLGKTAADGRYNQALMLKESRRADAAERAAQDAWRRYTVLQDDASARDAERLIAALQSASSEGGKA